MSTYIPPSTNADASNRALRTFVMGLGVDILTTAVAVLAVQIGDVEWTRAYWLALGALVGKTIVTSAVAYAARKLVPPSI